MGPKKESSVDPMKHGLQPQTLTELSPQLPILLDAKPPLMHSPLIQPTTIAVKPSPTLVIPPSLALCLKKPPPLTQISEKKQLTLIPLPTRLGLGAPLSPWKTSSKPRKKTRKKMTKKKTMVPT